MTTTQAMFGIDYWAKGWEEGRTIYHMSTVNNILLQFQDKLLVKKPSRVLVPLCGKTHDLKWLADQGHEVVGVEGALQPVQEFFQDQGLAYKESDVPGLEGATLYQTEDGKIKLYVCDFFKLSRDFAGEFDAVWDRGSLTAIEPSERQKYTDVLMSVVAPGAHIFTELFTFDSQERTLPDPPFPTTQADMDKWFGDKFSIEIVADNDFLAPPFKEWGLTWMRQHVYFMIAKS